MLQPAALFIIRNCRIDEREVSLASVILESHLVKFFYLIQNHKKLLQFVSVH